MTTEQEGDRVQLTTAGAAQEQQQPEVPEPEPKAGSESESQTCSNSTLTEAKETEESTAAASSSSAPSSAVSSSHDVTHDDEKEKLLDGEKEPEGSVLKVPLRDVESGVNPAAVMQAQRSSQSYGFGSIASLNEQVISNRPLSSSDPNDLKELLSDNPPRWGWVVVLAAWVIMIPIAGVLASYGTVVKDLSTEFNSTKLIAGWVGSLSFGFTVGMCPVSTVLFSVYGARKVASVGILGTVSAAVSTSFTNSIYVMFFTYSFLFGTGANFVYNTAMNLVGQYFPRKHQALATCLATAGISTGTLAINPLAQWLNVVYGWRWMYRIMSAAIFVVGFMCVAVMAPAPGSSNQDKVASSSGEKQEKEANDVEVNYTESKMSLAAKELRRNVTDNSSSCSSTLCANPGFILWLAGTLFWSISFLFPHIFLMDYMLTSLGIEQGTGSLVMLTYGSAELMGRFLCAGLAGCIPISLSYVYTICSLFAGAVALITPNVKSLHMMFFYGASAGINSGILNALMFVTTMQLFGNKRGIHIWGYINIMLALGMVAGPIMAGGIFDATNSYESAFIVGGSVFILCGIVMAAIKPLLNRFPLEDEDSSPVTESPRKPIYKRGAGKRSSRQYQVASAAAGNGTAHQNGKWGNDMTLQLEKLTELDEEVARSNRQSDDASAE